MTLSVLDIFTIGIGPSSSHTVGPMRAARQFVTGLRDDGEHAGVAGLRVELHGSLGWTGRGHGSDKAVVLGLAGETPEDVDPDSVDAQLQAVADEGRIRVADGWDFPFDPGTDIVFNRTEALPEHPNGMRFTAIDADGHPIRERTYYSVGGGFIIDESKEGVERIQPDAAPVPHPFRTAEELIARTAERGCSISSLMLENELARRPESVLRFELLRIWEVMQACVERGCEREGVLPGGLKVKRRAAQMHRQLSATSVDTDPLVAMEWVNLYALAVNEENAAGGRVVTAPTNGAAGIIPAVLHYYTRFVPGATEDGVCRFLLTAGAIGIIYKENASISGAEVGCQGEVGSACSMAAGALCEVLGGTPAQAENAAEIAMEHNLGLTCDPIGGLVQVPCIERNAIASVKAINAAKLALRGDGTHFVSLDKVIKTMRMTGEDMHDKYKETARGGLAVNVIEC